MKNKFFVLTLSLSIIIGNVNPFNMTTTFAANTRGFRYTQDFSGDAGTWDLQGVGSWETSYKKGGTFLGNWERYEDGGNGMLKLSPNSRPVFWFDTPVTNGNIRLSYDVCYTQSSGAWSYFWGGFQSVAGVKTSNGIEIDGKLDNTGLLNGFGIQTDSGNVMLYGMTVSGSGMSTKACVPGEWYKLDVIHENVGGALVSKYYVDGNLIYTRTDQNFTGSLYGVTLYSTGNNKSNAIYVDNLEIEHFYETEKDAKAVLGTSVVKTNIDAVTLGTKSSPASATYGGNTCWLMDSENTDINIVFSDKFKAAEFDGSLYTVEVDWYDTGKGYFRLNYDSLENNKKVGETIYTTGTSSWKTTVFTLNDADFGKMLDDKYDLQLSLNALTSSGVKASSAGVAVKEIRVKRQIAENPVLVTSKTDEVGHTFPWFSENKNITNTITNFSVDSQNVTVIYKLSDENGRVIYSKEEELKLQAGEKKITNTDISEVKRCDIYDWTVEVNYKNGGKSVYTPIKVAVIKTDPNGIKNDDIYFSMHGERYSTEKMKMGVEMLKLANVGGVRTSVYWNYLETAKGVYNWDKHKSKPFFDELKANGIEILPVMHGGSSYWGLGTTDMPYTASELEGWKGYIGALAPIFSDTYGIKRYEIWNEPDIEYFNPRKFDNVSNNGGTGKDYANLFKATKEIIQAVDENAKVGGPGMANVKYGWFFSQNDGYKYFTEMLDAGFANYADAVSVHPYGYLGEPVDENDNQLSGIKQYRDRLKSKNSNREYELWLSETGYTTADAKVDNAYNQGALNIRTAIYAKANDLSDLTSFYNLEKMGTIKTNREDMFGHISTLDAGGEKYGTYGVPEKSYLMIAAMNYVMAETETKATYNFKNGSVRVSRFESDKFGKDVLAFYTTEDSADIKLNLGVSEITYFDYLGNENILTSDDGIYNFTAESAPQYITGEFTTVEYSENKDAVIIKDIDTAVNGKVMVSIEAKTEKSNPSCIILETMNDGRVETIRYTKDTLKKGINTYTFDIDADECDSIAAFVWDADFMTIPECRSLKERTGGKQ